MTTPAAAPTAAHPLGECVRRMLDDCHRQLEGQPPVALHALVIEAVERPMLAWVLEKTGGNQTAAAQMLGINRNTLHRKLAQYGLL